MEGLTDNVENNGAMNSINSDFNFLMYSDPHGYLLQCISFFVVYHSCNYVTKD